MLDFEKFAADFLDAAERQSVEKSVETRLVPFRIMQLREACGAPSMLCKLALMEFGNEQMARHSLYILGVTSSKGTCQELAAARQYSVSPAAAMRVRESTGAELAICKRAVQLHKGDEQSGANHLRHLTAWIRSTQFRVNSAAFAQASGDSRRSGNSGVAGEGNLLGAHLVTPRLGYTHHGIYVGEGRVVHYSGLADGIQSGPVEEVELAAFAAGEKISRLIHDAPKFPPLGVVSRARSRIGESLYSVVGNNCEHFCHWCINGVHESPQVKRVMRIILPFPFNLLSDELVDWLTI